ncbi:MAG: hypothetical protein WKF58_11785 [Ilumatobacteraceae bacterium]
MLGVDHRLYFSRAQRAGSPATPASIGIVVAPVRSGFTRSAASPLSVLFGGLLVGANNLQRTAQVPPALAVVMNGIIVLAVAFEQRARPAATGWKLEVAAMARRAGARSGRADHLILHRRRRPMWSDLPGTGRSSCPSPPPVCSWRRHTCSPHSARRSDSAVAC